MALELCIDSAAWILHAIDVGAPDTLRGLRLRRPAATADAPVAEPHDCSNEDHAQAQSELDVAIRQAAAVLPYEHAQALWLVDVCGYRYGNAAKEAGTSTAELADRVRSGREQIRADIESAATPQPRP